jgi:hypothetical protein
MRKKALQLTGHGLYYTSRASMWGLVYPTLAITGPGHADAPDIAKAILGVLILAGIAITHHRAEVGLQDALITVYCAIGIYLALDDFFHYRK